MKPPVARGMAPGLEADLREHQRRAHALMRDAGAVAGKSDAPIRRGRGQKGLAAPVHGLSGGMVHAVPHVPLRSERGRS